MLFDGSRSIFNKKKWVAVDGEVKEALALYFHLRKHTEVQEAPEYKGMSICKICNKSAYQIACEEWETLSNSRNTEKKNDAKK